MIYILGVPRSGKSTLGQMLKAKYPQVNLFSTDAITNAITFSFKEVSSVTDADKLALCIKKFAEWNELLTEQKCVIDVGKMPIEQIYSIADEDDEIVCLGYGGEMTNEQIWELVENYHQEYDYTFNLGLEKAKKMWGNFARRDDNNKFFCKQKNIKYYDTSTNREAILKQIMQDLSKYFR